jgi:hypothetical protein
VQTVSPSSYCIIEHKHRYSAWAASRAASTNTCRFDVNTGKLIIEAVGLKELLADPELLPTPHSMMRSIGSGALERCKQLLNITCAASITASQQN